MIKIKTFKTLLQFRHGPAADKLIKRKTMSNEIYELK
jgi:hypothetical protein